jgi:hypothetical protein
MIGSREGVLLAVTVAVGDTVSAAGVSVEDKSAETAVGVVAAGRAVGEMTGVSAGTIRVGTGASAEQPLIITASKIAANSSRRPRLNMSSRRNLQPLKSTLLHLNLRKHYDTRAVIFVKTLIYPL